MSKKLMLFVLLCSFNAYADLPQNDLWKQDTGFAANFSEKEFQATIKELQTMYAPIVARLGGKLNIQGDWNDSTVNAYASQTGKTWNVQMFGGLARRPEVTLNGFKLVICHEIGHHVGGVPSSSWASYEGQADYYATHVCGKKLFTDYSQNVKLYKECASYAGKDQVACSLNLDAAQSLANLLAALAGDVQPSYDTFDPSEVTETQSAHPKAQCRLDTYLAGELCNMGWNDQVIPRNLNAVCDNRPKCWYAK
jgi:hypothetical protein